MNQNKISNKNTESLKKDQNEKKKSSFIKRLLSGIVLLVAAFCFLNLGGLSLLLAVNLISITAVFELERVFEKKDGIKVIASICTVAYYFFIFKEIETYSLEFVLPILIMLIYYVFTYPDTHFRDVANGYFGFIYGGILLSFIYLTRDQFGKYLVWLIFISAWGTDTCAYVSGMLFGKHKMCPILSPKKTIEGAVGGIIGTGILAGIFSYVFRAELTNMSYLIVLSSMLAGALSMIGDLSASAIKRNYDVKDYGHIIPGHGGIMDRFDSVLFTAPVIYYMLKFFA